MTNLRADTPTPILYLWQFIAGLGIGPTLAVFTIIVQNAVPWQKLGVATSNLTFFRQVGGTVGLAIAGTVFAQDAGDPGSDPGWQLADRGRRDSGSASAVPGGPVELDGLQPRPGHERRRHGRRDPGQHPANRPRRSSSRSSRPSLAAFTRRSRWPIADTMWISMIATAIAAVAALGLKELPLRSSVGANSTAARKPASDGIPVPVSATAKSEIPAKKLPATE